MEELAAVLFIGGCLFIPMLLSIFIDLELPKVPDFLRRKEKIVIQHVYIYKTVKNKPKPKPIKEIKAELQINKQENLEVKMECLQCLLSLGMKKSDAKNKIEAMWKIKNIIPLKVFLSMPTRYNTIDNKILQLRRSVCNT